MTAYYNEIDPYAAQWLRNLIEAGHIAPGYVDERSIEDVYPSDLRGFTQCHFFAGIGIWSYALRSAGWTDDRPVWTGSCPCQPFSAAGKGAGFDDERHLWPAFHHLISQCRPECVIGEQVASSDTGPWIDLVHTDLEALGYAFGAVPFPSAGVGAPHIRDRLYWVANTKRHDCGRKTKSSDHRQSQIDRSADRTCGCVSSPCGMAYADSNGLKARDGIRLHGEEYDTEYGRSSGAKRPGPTNSHRRAADWLLCRDGRWRPVSPGTFPLVNGTSSRVGRLRAYGNAINAIQAQTFIECLI